MVKSGTSLPSRLSLEEERMTNEHQELMQAWDAIKSHIDANNRERALSQARTWKKQLDEIKAIIF